MFHSCICSGVIASICPGVGVCIAIAFAPLGVAPVARNPLGVKPASPCGVAPPCGVKPAIPAGVAPMPRGVCGVWPPISGVCSSQRDLRLLAEGVGVSETIG